MTQCPFETRALSVKACLQLVLAAMALAGCGDDEASSSGTPPSYFDDISDSGYPNRPGDGPDAGPAPDQDASVDASQSDAGSGSAERGRYLVHHVAACVECHTPRDVVGRLDETLLLSGVECFRDGSANHDRTGCQHTGNLTDHETGLQNRSDLEIKAMFLEGMRPNGQALHPNMPYFEAALACVAALVTACAGQESSNALRDASSHDGSATPHNSEAGLTNAQDAQGAQDAQDAQDA